MEIKPDHIKPSQIRPRFKFKSPQSVDEIAHRIKSALAAGHSLCEGRIIHGHATIYIPENERHYWSPQLNLSIEAVDGGSIIRGLYGPRPEVWTMFVLFYTIIGIAILLVLVFGLSYMSLGQPHTILWWVPVLSTIFLSLYLVSYFGQRLGKQQLITLHNFVENSLGIPFEEN